MDQGRAKRLQADLKLNEQQKQTVRALKRQISSHSASSPTTESGDHVVAKLSEEELSLLRTVVQTLTSYKADSQPVTDEIDGKRLQRDWSVETYLSSSRGSGNFVNPGRFYVRVTKEDVRTLEQVCLELDKEEKAEATENSNSNGKLQNNYLPLNHYDNKYKNYGFSVALTQQSEKVIVTKNTTLLGAIPEEYSNKNNFSHTNGSVSKYKTSYTGKLRNLPPRDRFRQAVYLVINNLKMRPRKMDKDFSELWRKRGKATWLNIFFSVVAIVAFFADIGTDLKVAADHFTKGNNYWWGSFTLLLVFVPSVITNLVSFFWYKEDDKELERPPKSGWKVVSVTHLFLVGLVERYWRVLVKAYRIKRRKATRVVDNKLLIAMNLDLALLQMILAFTEDAPQLVLQMYVLISRHYVEQLKATRIQDLWTILSICFSFISYSRAVVNYISCLRDSKRHKGQLRWYGYLSMWLWRAFMIISRILTLVFFATEFKMWFFLVLFLHFFVVLAFLVRHEIYFFPGNNWKQHFFRAVMCYIHLFCFFCLEGVRTYSWAVKYYILTFFENLVFSVLWYTNSTSHLPWEIELAGFILIYTCFSFGLLMMTVYYKFLHPRFNRPRFKLGAPLKSELADKDPENGAAGQKFELWI